MAWIGILGGVLLLLCAGLYLGARGQKPAELAAGVLLGVRGLLAKEFRSRSRGWRPVWLLTGYLAALTLAVAGFLALAVRASGVIVPVLGTWLFSTLAVGSVLLLAFITPALTAGAISGERERRTLDLLLVTRASALGLVSGKLLGALFYILFLLFASLPAFTVVYLFGGVPLRYLAMTLAVAAVTALAHAALGLLCSALLKRTVVASVVAYLLVFVLVLGIPFVAAVSTAASVGRQGQPAGPPPAYVYASPLTSLASVLPGGASGAGVPLLGDLMRVALVSGMVPLATTYTAQGGYVVARPSVAMAQSVYVVGRYPPTGQPQTVTTWAPWVYHFLFSAVLTLICMLAAALLVAPVKPWQAWRARRRLRPAQPAKRPAENTASATHG
jgi:ABC-type transport system involved in multi-copper enzyme maturation permease subunit